MAGGLAGGLAGVLAVALWRGLAWTGGLMVAGISKGTAQRKGDDGQAARACRIFGRWRAWRPAPLHAA